MLKVGDTAPDFKLKDQSGAIVTLDEMAANPHVPPFSWGTRERLEEYDIERFLGTAALAMSRREMSLEEAARTLLRRAWERTRPQRQ